jgi:intracellular septation protein
MEVRVVRINGVKAKQDVNPLLKIGLEMGPLVVFFTVYIVKDIYYATAALMVATLVSLIASRLLLKRLPIMALVTGAFVMVFGSLTIYLQNPTFMYVKPTILNLVFAAVLAGGLLFRKLLLKIVLSEALQLQDKGWRLLTFRWIGFFIFLAIMNEIVWRNFSERAWAQYKTFGVMPLTMLFMMAQITLIVKYQLQEVSSEPSEISTT